MICPSCNVESLTKNRFCIKCGFEFVEIITEGDKAIICTNTGNCPSNYRARAEEIYDFITNMLKTDNIDAALENNNRIYAMGDVTIPEGLKCNIITTGNVNLVTPTIDKFVVHLLFENKIKKYKLARYQVMHRVHINDNNNIMIYTDDGKTIRLPFDYAFMSRHISRDPIYLIRYDNSIFIVADYKKPGRVTLDGIKIECNQIYEIHLMSNISINDALTLSVHEEE